MDRTGRAPLPRETEAPDVITMCWGSDGGAQGPTGTHSPRGSGKVSLNVRIGVIKEKGSSRT